MCQPLIPSFVLEYIQIFPVYNIPIRLFGNSADADMSIIDDGVFLRFGWESHLLNRIEIEGIAFLFIGFDADVRVCGNILIVQVKFREFLSSIVEFQKIFHLVGEGYARE